MPTKVIVTNRKALRKKYGTKLATIDSAIASLVAHDEKRGVAASVVDLSSAADMARVKGQPVGDASDPKENKQAIDAVFGTLQPDYLLILGSIDVVPHQDLRNPVYDEANDRDEHAWGDLPYACAAPYGTNVGNFVGPTRVVGRLPDLTRGKDAAYLVRLIGTARSWRRKPAKSAKSYFAVTADAWKQSTRLSVRKLFGTTRMLKTSPLQGYRWKRSELSPVAHFINCHGAPADMHFYGEGGKDQFPVAHQADYLTKRISGGTVAAAECCYGADLYDPGIAAEKHPSICNTYLEHGAYGFFGSTTIAYGPADSNGAADLICQYFLRCVAQGASLGRAALEARQEFVRNADMTDPINLKTLAQFNLLGDPSIHAFTAAKAKAAAKKKGRGAATAKPKTLAETFALQRHRLVLGGLSLGARTPVAKRKATPANIRERLRAIAEKVGLVRPRMMTFVRGEQSPAAANRASKAMGKEFVPPPVPRGSSKRVHVMFATAAAEPPAEPPKTTASTEAAKPPTGAPARKSVKSAATGKQEAPAAPAQIAHFVAIVADEVGGKLRNIRTLYAK